MTTEAGFQPADEPLELPDEDLDVVPPALDIAQLKISVQAAHYDIAEKLNNARARRDELNAQIRWLAEQEAEAARALKALTPRAKK